MESTRRKWDGSQAEGDAAAETWLRQVARAPTLPLADLTGGRLVSGATLCGGRFVVIRLIGAGGMGVVYAANDLAQDTVVAIKALPAVNGAAIYGLKSEFRSIADLSHPNLVQLHELFADGERYFFSMELVDGEPFDRWTRPTDLDVHDIDLARLSAGLSQLLSAIEAIHATGKLHRDIKPSNVLVTPEGRVVVLDFGLAADPEPGGVGQTLDEGTVTGTPAYMAPEQAAGRTTSAASDIYAVGAMLYEILSGCLPFNGTSGEIIARKQTESAPPLLTVAPSIDPKLAELCDAMLARVPHARPSLAAVRERLEAALAAVVPAEPLKVYESPPSARTSRPPESATQSGTWTRERETLIGREAELRTLRAAFDATLEGSAVVVVVSGESGMGKSTLIDAFLQRIRARSHGFVLSGRCFERESVPFKGFDSLVDDLSRSLRKLPALEAAALMPRDVYALARLFPVLDRIDAVAQQPRKEVADLQELRSCAFQAFAELLARMRDRRPLVLCVDDWQWVDRDSTLLMRALLSQPEPIPMLTIVCHRSEGGRDQTILARIRAEARTQRRLEVRELAVGPLSESATTELAQRLLHDDASGQLARAAARESGGSPFFTVELARYAAALRDEHRLPGLTLSYVLAQRVATLPEPSRRALQLMALAASPLPVDVVQAAIGATHADLDVLRSAQLTRHGQSEHGRSVECYHDRIRETVERSIRVLERRELYAALARALGGRKEADAELLSRCLEGAGALEEAAQSAELAGDRAAHAMAFGHGTRLYQRARMLAAKPQLALLEKLGNAFADAGRGVDASSAYQDAALLGSREQSIDLRRRAAEQLLRTGHAKEGTALMRAVCRELGIRLPGGPRSALASIVATRALIKLRGLTPRASQEGAARALSSLDRLRLETAGSAVTGLFNCEPVVAAALADRYLIRALDAGDPAHLSRALGFTAYFNSFANAGSLTRCSELLELGMRYAEQTGRPEAIGFMRVTMGHVAVHCGSISTSRPHYAAAFELLRGRSGVAWEIGIGHIYDKSTAFLHGDFAGIAREAPALLDAAHAGSNVLLVSAMSGWCGAPAWLAAGDTAGYRERLSDARKLWTPQREMQWPDWFMLIGEVLLALYSGEPGTGFSRLHAEWPAYHRSIFARTEVVRAMTHWARGGCAVAALNRRGASSDLHKEWLAVARKDAATLAKSSLKQAQAWGLGIEAGLALAINLKATAIAKLRAALTTYDEVGYAMYAAAARRRLGELIGGEEGRTLCEQGNAVMRAQGVVNPDAICEMLVPGCGSD